jgi:hypothetical protein
MLIIKNHVAKHFDKLEILTAGIVIKLPSKIITSIKGEKNLNFDFETYHQIDAS